MVNNPNYSVVILGFNTLKDVNQIFNQYEYLITELYFNKYLPILNSF